MILFDYQSKRFRYVETIFRFIVLKPFAIPHDIYGTRHVVIVVVIDDDDDDDDDSVQFVGVWYYFFTTQRG